ncbi:glycosyltransferase [Roseiconus nitratireducens]|uniref:Glycosyltransferase n=1 Tax=Roseiconus nitratireducens TaxID=2605748 RepID=A0A5M6D3B9_9BACT|nr:glycosyltransferase family 2 protein [Roseiconus nitratireducens]KAA5541833.1 glycosyltransferase [Roseiconus nitratireducens]
MTSSASMPSITFGITTFNRPRLLRRLIESIRTRYPHVRILVADNGSQHATLPDDVQVLHLPFDCGLSRARNALIDALETEFLLVLEDDFQFTDETDIEPLWRVLRSDPEIGVAGGAIRGCDGRVTCYALDIEVCRTTMRVREAPHRIAVTPCGIPYRLCDMVWNFALFRREMLREHRWVDALKIGEHCPFFYEVKLARRWRVASCSLPKIYHVPDRRPTHYLKYRRRAADYFRAYLNARGVEHYERVLPYHYEDDATLLPPVIVLAVGHSGTSVVTRMLQKLGWNLGRPVDKVFAEHIEIRKLNRQVIDGGQLDTTAARQALGALPMPWALKDPRFVQTLQHWLPLLAELEIKPVLLRLRRELSATKGSYHRRGAPGDVDRRIENLAASRDHLYDLWPWKRLTLEYEKIAAAVSMFDLDRFEASQDRDPGEVEGPSFTPSPRAIAGDSRAPEFGLTAAEFIDLNVAALENDSSMLASLQLDSAGANALADARAAFQLDSSFGRPMDPQEEGPEPLSMQLDSSVGSPAAADAGFALDSGVDSPLERAIRRELRRIPPPTANESHDGSD